MTDRVYPSSKTNGNTKATTTAAATTTPNPRLPPPPSKTQIQKPIPNRHPHRPNPINNQRIHRRRSRSRRGCFCLCCFWSVLIIILLLLIATVAGCILYLLYHPHRPTFSIAALKISEFNLTTTADDDTTRVTSRLNLTISTRNPNKKIIFYYDPIAITCLSHETQIANGSFANPFVSNPNNITIIRSSLHSNSLLLDAETVNHMRSDLKKKSGLPLKILLDTEAQVKIESIRSKKIGIRIKCEGIHSLIPKGGGRKSRNSSSSSVSAAIVSAAKCKLDLRVKIWKWTF